MSLHPANGIAELPKHRSELIAARNPWDAQRPLSKRDQRMRLLRQRQTNPLPPSSPYWNLVKF